MAGMSAKDVIDRWEEQKAHKSDFESDMEIIGKWCAPDRLPDRWTDDDSVIKRDLVDTTSIDALERLAALLFGFMFPATSPWALPEIEGRDPNYDEASWLDHVRDGLHLFFKRRSKTWRMASAEAMHDIAVWGPGGVWIDSKPFQPPRFKAIPVAAMCYGEDEDGEKIPFFWEHEMQASAATRQYPDNAKLKKKAGEAPDEMVVLIHAVFRREGGRRGHSRLKKPFAGYTVWLDDQVMLEETGYDDLPAAVGKFKTRAGDRYGTGAGRNIAPLAKRLNRLEESVTSGAEKAVDPPLFDMTGGAIKKIDRRPGAINRTDVVRLGLAKYE